MTTGVSICPYRVSDTGYLACAVSRSNSKAARWSETGGMQGLSQQRHHPREAGLAVILMVAASAAMPSTSLDLPRSCFTAKSGAVGMHAMVRYVKPCERGAGGIASILNAITVMCWSRRHMSSPGIFMCLRPPPGCCRKLLHLRPRSQPTQRIAEESSRSALRRVEGVIRT